ncbi:MAG: hypothetical protein ACD_15C00086G0001 [uncultured bacterium]|nr:MAG: hypothetical protein ACD_15C00086G0001 [uncultured bacterium]
MKKPSFSSLPPEIALNSKKKAVFYLFAEIKQHLEYVLELLRRVSRLIDFHMK